MLGFEWIGFLAVVWTLGFLAFRAPSWGSWRYAWVVASLELVAATLILTAVLFIPLYLLGLELPLASFSILSIVFGLASIPFQLLKACTLTDPTAGQQGVGLSPAD